MSIESVMPSNHLILHHSLLLLLSIFPRIRIFSNELALDISSVQFHCWVMSNSLWPHGLQHARPPCPSPTPRVYSDSCPLSQWCHPIISFSVVPFSSCLQSFPASGSFICHFFASGWSFSFSIISSKEIPGLIFFRMDWLDLLAVQGTPKSLFQHHISLEYLIVSELSHCVKNLGFWAAPATFLVPG